MCGIFAIISKSNKSINEDELVQGISLLKHRGPDGNKIFVQDSIGFAHTRLSIFDLSKEADQPFSYQDLVVLFNGAIYNFVELRSELITKGYSFRTTSDTEVIAASYKEWGSECVTRFNGMWSLLIYNSLSKDLFCSRDRFGIKPFYYYESNENVYISSEVKAIVNLPHFKKEINIEVANRYLDSGIQNSTDETFFKGVKCLSPGTNMFIDGDAKYTFRRFYSLPDALSKHKAMTFKEACVRLMEELKRACRIEIAWRCENWSRSFGRIG